MPYVEGFGTWPFGEEWLWEAVATVYLPLLEVVGDAPVTIGLTPVLCDQLEALRGEAGGRFLSFLADTRAQIHARDAEGLERAGAADLAGELRRAAGDYDLAASEFERRGSDLLRGFRELAEGDGTELWTGPATHPVLPLLATDAGLHLQLASGAASHERRFGARGTGFWLPECAFEPGLEEDLAEHGVVVFCIDQSDALGLGSFDQLEPVETEAGPIAIPIDWQTVALVWDEERGYPASAAYRDHHRRTVHDLKPWSNSGEAYDHGAALALANAHAQDFVARAIERLDGYRAERGRPGLLCCALDAELLGHWWYEGPHWLEAVLAEARAQGLELTGLTAALERVDPVRRELHPSSWGYPKDLSTWDGPRVADVAFAARAAELRTVAAAGAPNGRPRAERQAALERGARELMALQSSDWAFQLTRDSAGDYPLQRVRAHVRALDRALAALKDSGAEVPTPGLRYLAPDVDTSSLLCP
jgi:1,4-alpha-glucan branching enzyme